MIAKHLSSKLNGKVKDPSKSRFPTSGPMDIFVMEAYPIHCRMVSRILGFSSLDASCFLSPLWQSKTSPDITKYPCGCKITSGQELLI